MWSGGGRGDDGRNQMKGSGHTQCRCRAELSSSYEMVPSAPEGLGQRQCNAC